MVREKNIIINIILSILTIGLYGLYWMCTITDDVDTISENPTKRDAIVIILLTIVTFGIYRYYYWYQNGKLMEETNQKKGINGSSSPVLYLILALFGQTWVNYILIQNDINKYAIESNM